MNRLAKSHTELRVTSKGFCCFVWTLFSLVQVDQLGSFTFLLGFFTFTLSKAQGFLLSTAKVG